MFYELVVSSVYWGRRFGGRYCHPRCNFHTKMSREPTAIRHRDHCVEASAAIALPYTYLVLSALASLGSSQSALTRLEEFF